MAAPRETLRTEADRLARLLADARGAEILAGLQALSVRQHSPGEAPAPPVDGLDVGVWRAERTAEGVALRRTRRAEGCHWAGVDYVPPPAGAQRVVVIGESVARGCGWQFFSPTGALAQQLGRVAPGRYQCVDLDRSGATLAALTRLAGQLPAAEPDVLVVIAGNNWALTEIAGEDAAAGEDGLGGALGRSLCEGGPAAMRRTYIDQVVLPRARRFLDSVLALHARGTQVVIVVPESNLRGWVPAPSVEVPVLPPETMARWYELRAQAERALAAARWEEARDAAGQMTRLDGGTSPVPGQLLARAGLATGDGAAARAGLAASHDAAAGLGLPGRWSAPRIIGEVADLLTGFAAANGFPCVDLRAVLASADVPELPDQRLFHDYCHLTDEGMELMMSAVTDAIAGHPPGTTRPGPGIGPELRSLVYVTAAARSAYFGQPAQVVDRYLRAAVDADPKVTPFLTALLEMIEGADPRWAHPAIPTLAKIPLAAGAFAPVLLARDVAHTLWALRACLWDILGTAPPPTAGTRTAPTAGTGTAPPTAGTQMDLLIPGSWPDFGTDRAYHRSTSQRQPLGFALRQPLAGTLTLTYRTPGAPPGTTAQVSLNEQPLGTLAASRTWAQARFELPAHATRAGLNWLSIRWPVPAIDTGPQYATGAAMLDRRAWPDLLPVFGELFDARVTLAAGSVIEVHGGQRAHARH